jgi:NIPSNAP
VSIVMKSTFQLKFGGVDRFVEAMEAFVPALTEEGWRLIGAYRGATGDVHRAIHIWQIPDYDAVVSGPARAVAANPALLAEIEALSQIIEREELEVLAALPYDPAQA